MRMQKAASSMLRCSIRSTFQPKNNKKFSTILSPKNMCELTFHQNKSPRLRSIHPHTGIFNYLKNLSLGLIMIKYTPAEYAGLGGGDLIWQRQEHLNIYIYSFHFIITVFPEYPSQVLILFYKGRRVRPHIKTIIKEVIVSLTYPFTNDYNSTTSYAKKK